MTKCMKLVALGFGLAWGSTAATISLNTGQANWQVQQTANTGGTGNTNNGAALNSASTAVALAGTLPTLANFPGIGANAWVQPTPPAAWVGQVNTDGQVAGFGCSNSATVNCGANPGTYVYTLTFGSGFAGTGSFNFNFTADNFIQSLTVLQGSTTLFSYVPSNQGNIQNAFKTTGLLSNIVGGGGDVVISATVINGFVQPGILDRNSSGFLLQGSANVPDAAPIPEPSTYAMTGLAVLLAAAARLRRK